MKRKLLTLLLIITLVITGTACGNNNNNNQNTSNNTGNSTPPTQENNTSNNQVNNTINTDNINLLSIINTSYASSSLDVDYTTPMYSLPQDYVFEFEATDSIIEHANNAFKVHTRADLSDFGIAKSSYSNGILTVSAISGIIYNENGASQNQENWGSYNKLYLTQYYDLQTGEKLDTPIVTPFSIKHDLESPVATQSVGEGNLWTLSWTPVPGAVKYNIYASFNEYGDSVVKECETTSTSIVVSDLASQQRSDNLLDAFGRDLATEGYDIEQGTDFYLNSTLHGLNNYFVVVAFDANGNQSGISNIIDTNNIASLLPYSIAHPILEVNINSISDVPAYVDVEMVDGSIKQMLINYHGAETVIYPDDPTCVGIKAHICNTNFSPFLLKIKGMTYEDFMSQVSVITQRQDSLNTTGGGSTPTLVIASSPDSAGVDENNTEATSRAAELGMLAHENENNTTEPEQTEEPEQTVEPTVENTSEPETPTTDQNLVVIPNTDGMTTYDLYLQALEVADSRLQYISDIHEVIYANTQLEAWLAYALVTNLDIIPVPVAVFPEAANEEYLAQLLMEAYRQNPTSGMLTGLGMSYELESLVPYYAEDVEARINKTIQELSTAKQIASTLSGTERERVYSINQYLCDTSSYDYDSTATSLEDESVLTEAFIDAHTPYGILCNNYGVCESYSEAFALIARFSGINALMETGYMDGGAHEWNRVQVDGTWCVVDVTNNDIELTEGLLNALLNVTDKQISNNFTIDGTSIINNLPATDDINEYYNVNGNCANSSQEAVNIVAEQLQSNGYAQVRLNFVASEDEAYNIVYQAYEKSGVTPESYMIFMGILVVM